MVERPGVDPYFLSRVEKAANISARNGCESTITNDPKDHQEKMRRIKNDNNDEIEALE